MGCAGAVKAEFYLHRKYVHLLFKELHRRDSVFKLYAAALFKFGKRHSCLGLCPVQAEDGAWGYTFGDQSIFENAGTGVFEAGPVWR